jgi:hypothetical protein
VAYASSRWPVIAAANLNDGDQTDKLYQAQIVDVYHHTTIVYWTDDGTVDGATVFSASLMPYVSVMVSASGQERDWTQGMRSGPMIRGDYLSNIMCFAWHTEKDTTNGIWITRIFRKGDPEYTGTGGGEPQGQDDDKPFLAFCSAIGFG